MKQIVEKSWGREIIFVNNEKYCGKLLCFDKAGSKGSMHFHGKKTETWYVQQGSFIVYYINTANANKCSSVLKQGDTWTNEVFEPHQLEALEDDSIVFEVSTHDDPHDSYRVEKGDSQS